MNPLSFSDPYFVKIRDEIVNYVSFVIGEALRGKRFNENNKIPICDVNEIFYIIGIDIDVIIWCFLGSHPNRKDWGLLSQKFPYHSPVKFLLTDFEIPNLCKKYNVKDNLKLCYKIKKDNIILSLKKISESKKNFSSKDVLIYENEKLKQEIMNKEERIIMMEKEISFLKSRFNIRF